MTAIVIKAFGGLKPITNPFLLQSGDATVAQNVRLVSGAVIPLKATSLLRDLSKPNARTIWRYGTSPSEQEFWLEFLADTDVINSPIPQDVYGRVYWADGGTPKYAPNNLLLSGSSYPGASYTLGIPAPTSAPSVVQSAYSRASTTISLTQIQALPTGAVLVISVDGGADQQLALSSSGGVITAVTLTADLNKVPGLNASITSDGNVKLETESASETSAFVIRRKTGDTKDYSQGVTYTGFIGPVYGVSGTPSTGATYEVTQAQLASLEPGSKIAVKVNSNPDVLVTAAVGANTFPSAVTAASFKSALASVAGLTSSVNETTAPSVTLTTTATGQSASLQLRIVNPVIVPTYAAFVSASNAQSASNRETRAYTYTYVSAYGEEGPPSNPSSVTTVDPNAAVSVGNLSIPPGGAYNIASKRIYRTSTVGSTAEYQFVTEVPAAITAYTDTKTQAELGEVLPSSDWVAPPAGLRGLKMMANGVAVGFVANTVHLCEPNLPHAWPHKYPVDYQIVGLAPFRQSVAVLTTGHPFLLSGADPGAMTAERLEFPHACLSKASIVETGDGCLYAGADGVVSIGAGGMKVVSDQLFSREQWQALNPASMLAFFHDSRYHVFYQDVNNVRGMLIFDFSGQGALLTTSDISSASPVVSGYSDARTDTLYLAQGGKIVRYNAGLTSLTSRWATGVYRLIKPISFSFGLIRAKSYPVTLRIRVDNRPTDITRVVNSSAAFRLPSGFLGQQWQFDIEATDEVSMLAIATSAAELQAIT